MATKTWIAGAASAALLIGLSAGQVTAQADEQAAMVDTITVVAPRISQERQHHGVSTVVVMKRDAFVSFADLDLSRVADLEKLESRVDAAARRLCEELAEMSPFGEPNMALCIRRAVNAARSQVREATQQAIAW
jgi:UrcA family protein